MALRLTIVTPEKTVYNGEVKMVTVPGMQGEFQILPKHAPIVSILTKGNVSYIKSDDTTDSLQVAAGFVSVQRDQVNVCVEV